MPPTTASPEAAAEAERPTPAPAPPEASTLEVGAADDQYEQAADATADKVLRRLADQGELGGEVAGGATHGGGMGRAGGAVDAQTNAVIDRSRGGGSPLPTPLRRSMEGAFGGADFSRVRLHTGPSAATLNRTLGATAFTVGNDVFMGSNAPSLDSRQGQHLLAHELTHTQQDAGGARRTVRRELDDGESDTVTFHPEAEEDDESAPLLTPASEAAENQDPLAADPAEAEFDLMVRGSRAIDAWRGTKDSPMDAIGLGTKAVGAAAATGHGAAKGVQKVADTTNDVASESAESATDQVKESVKDGVDPEALKAGEEILGVISGAVNYIKSAYTAVKAITEAVDSAGLESGTVAVKSVNAVKSSVELGKSAMDVVNASLKPLDAVTGPMLSAVPGLGVAIGVLDVLVNGIALGQAYSGWSKMKDSKQAAKVELIGARDLEQNRTWWGGNRSAVDIAAQILADAEKAPDKADKDKVKAAKNYQLTRSLQLIGGKRIRRNLLNITAALPGIAGDILTLTGVGAAVGTGLKIGGAALKGGAVLFRMGKQLYNDIRGNEKSKANKLIAYDKTISALTANVISAGSIKGAPGQEGRDDVLTQVAASGMSARNMRIQVETSVPDLGQSLWTAWIAALKNRDGT